MAVISAIKESAAAVMPGRAYPYGTSRPPITGPKTKPITELSFNPDLLRLINVKYIYTDEKILDCEKYQSKPQRYRVQKVLPPSMYLLLTLTTSIL